MWSISFESKYYHIFSNIPPPMGIFRIGMHKMKDDNIGFLKIAQIKKGL